MVRAKAMHSLLLHAAINSATIPLTMPRESKNPASSEAPASPKEPPYLYIRACGALCDAFWWARRSVPARESSEHERDESTPALPPARS
jgi:hypothetical protein